MGSLNKLSTCLHFFCAGMMNHRQTGAIVPSQGRLVSKMLSPVPKSFCGRILELGAGTGALTSRLAAKCPDARILACEVNPTLARDARHALDSIGVNGRVSIVTTPAEDLLADLAHGEGEAPSYIVSGIPLGNFSRERTQALVDAIWRVLPRGGMFIQFQYSLLSRQSILSRFPHTRIVPVLLNIPPAVVYFAPR